MRKLTLLGLLMVLGLSFATATPTGPEWGNFVQTCCQGDMAYSFGQNVYGNYAVWDGQTCYVPEVYDPQALNFLMWGFKDNPSVAGYYEEMLIACEGDQNSQECLTAKSQFNSFAKSARGTFTMYFAQYMSTARRAIAAYYGPGECETSPGQVSSDLREAMGNYRRCIRDGCRD